MRPSLLLYFAWLTSALLAQGADEVFSGPQLGEPLRPFQVRLALGANAGQEADFVAQAKDGPLVLVFVHDVNRQSVGLTRILTKYTVSRRADGLHTGVIWLADDVTEAENTLRRIQHALTADAPTGISVDGGEGPGAYGLNRNMTLTILVGNKGKVTANFALVQPSLQADLPKILDAVVQVAGGKAPPLAELLEAPQRMTKPAATEPDVNLRGLLRPIIQQDATVEQVDAAVKKLESYLQDHPATRSEVRRIAKTIVDSGKLSNYGTARAQEYLRKWAAES